MYHILFIILFVEKFFFLCEKEKKIMIASEWQM